MEAFWTGVQSHRGKPVRFYINVASFSSFKLCPVKKKKRMKMHDLVFSFQCVDGSTINHNIAALLSPLDTVHRYRNLLFPPRH